MSTLNKCPKCGASLTEARYGHLFSCQTWQTENQVDQSMRCLARQRDQLLQKVQRLEEAGHSMAYYLTYGPFSSDVRQQSDDIRLRISAWNQAKETKP